MKRIIALLLVAVMCIGLVSCMPNLKKFAIRFANDKIGITEDDINSDEYLAFSEKLESFSSKISADIYKKYGANSNFCISPASIYMSLAIAAECSTGETRQEILDALGMSYEELSTYTKYFYSLHNSEYKYLDENGKEGISATETLISSIWLDSSLGYNPSAVEYLASNYNCDVFGASFSSSAAKKMINQYIEYKTDGAIAGNLTIKSNLSFAIISAMALHEIWNDIGKELSLTFDSHNFVESDGTTSSTQLLRGHYSNGKVYESDKYSTFFIESEHGYRLHFIVPTEEYTLKDVFTSNIISEVIARDDYGYIDDENGEINYTRILFPPISSSFSADISELLTQKYGIESLFDEENCDFSTLVTDKVSCNAFLHHNRLNITSGGINSSSVKIKSSTATSPELPEYKEIYNEFLIDRAFGFVLTDENGMILYSGVINELN